jgi:hypothetical protein
VRSVVAPPRGDSGLPVRVWLRMTQWLRTQ